MQLVKFKPLDLNQSQFSDSQKQALLPLYLNDDRQIQSLFSKNIDEFERAYDESRKLIHSETSIIYAKQIGIAETALESLKEVVSRLGGGEQETAAVKNSQLKLNEMYSNHPIGESLFSVRDEKLISQWATIPPESTISSALGSFYNPHISQKSLYEWFNRYVKQGNYDGSTCMFRVEQIGQLPIDGVATCFTLVKKKTKQNIFDKIKFIKDSSRVSKAIETCSSEFSIVQPQQQYGYYHILKRFILNTSYSCYSKVINCVTPYAEDSSSRDPSWNYQDNMTARFVTGNSPKNTVPQNDTLTALTAELARHINDWNYQGYMILTSETQLQMGISSEMAMVGDRILLYYKKVDES